VTGQVIESIFDGKTHIIPLAEVSHIRKMERVTSLDPFPDLPEHIIVYMKHTALSSPEIFLMGEEMANFTRDWCCYRSELEKDTLYPMHAVQPEAPLAIDDMVSRFLSWRLPDDFRPDCGIRFAPLNHPNSWPIGTNLFTATQAKAMLEHVLKKPVPPGAE
jgi:hypothetical protein